VVSYSQGAHLENISKAVFDFPQIVHPYDNKVFIHIPSPTSHASAQKTMSSLDSSLVSLGLAVSTGRIVDFRLQDALREQPERGTVPLLHPCHFNGGTVHWPKLSGRKPNAILDNDEVRPWLVPSGIYLLTKRFTAKEERRRLVACLFDPNQVPAKRIGIENHLNYFHANGHGLERDLAVGLYIFLNSTGVDQYFRQFSGHTQVNATDLRTLPYPDRDTLRAMGRKVKNLDLTQKEIDQLLAAHIHDNLKGHPKQNSPEPTFVGSH
jgi:adenine-specific DNA-methyltransferase